jgi:hypothetical protein
MSEATARGRGSWHDERGWFVPGNPGGPGNPMARELARVRLRLAERVTDDVFDKVVDKLVDMSLQGHLGAIRLLMQYRAGRPDRSVSIDDLEADEMRGWLRKDDLARTCARVMQQPPPEAPPAPAGRPEAQWRRAEREAPRAEPPAGSAPHGPALRQAAEALRAALEAMEGGEGRSGVPIQTITDTSVPTVRGPAGAAPPSASGGAGG